MILYTIDCPACRVLENKLKEKNIKFTKIMDEELFEKMRFDSFPILQLDNDNLLNFSQAIKWLKEENN